MNPVTLWRHCFQPQDAQWTNEQTRYVDTALFFLFLSFLTGVYSLVKWSSNGHEVLTQTSILLIIVELAAGLTIRFLRAPVLALNLGFFGMSLHCLNMIYQTGGFIGSSQSLWVPVMIIAFYLCASTLMASLWSLMIGGTTLAMVLAFLEGAAFPEMALSGRAQAIEMISGVVVPLLVIATAQGFTARLRRKALADSEQAQLEMAAAAEQARQGQQQLNEVMQQVRLNVNQLMELAADLDGQSHSLHQHVDTLNNNCSGQSCASEQMTAQLQQLTEDMNRSDQFVSDLQHHSDTINQQAQRSSSSLQASTGAIDRILTANEKITSVADLITSVAEQTNLLALNAAIEAARAGEQGRGFAVVAEQVRELSAKSNGAALEIRTILEEGRKEVNHGQQVMQSTTSEISGIIAQVSTTQQEVSQLTDIFKHQAQAVEELYTASAEVSSGVVDTSQVAEQVAEQGAKLAHQVTTIKGLTASLTGVVDNSAPVSRRE
ncbi:Methyl-accepting chemotaxis protein [Ferrimonas sediminum]|uniref:Methyl-accepting chemotaxis protein n=1 Tax=Ferrimonas sediminum TaxID=718193 RepID=A0A1G8RYI7_9GAMM|nr:methyl-accepting chemotaxis protein [Ferrimonas sediminum]SDJ22017.1 Methyl-accepting chemotaxis protein [Ferrimonas sediminum]